MFARPIVRTAAPGLVMLALALSALPAGAPASAQVPTPTPPACQPIREALDQKLISVDLTGTGNLFFRDAVAYNVENVGAKRLTLCFPAGTLLMPDDPGLQRLVLGETVIFSLDPGEVKQGTLFVFCTQSSKEAPPSGAMYTVGAEAEPDLLRLAQVIDQRSGKGRLGAQLAVWAVSDGLTLDDLNAEPGAGGPSTVATIRPLLCLASGEVGFGQEALVAAQVKERLYTGENPVSPAYCASQGLPALNIDQLKARLEFLGIRAGLVVILGTCGCLVVLALVIFLIVRLVRKK
jgi:hypothetical protein